MKFVDRVEALWMPICFSGLAMLCPSVVADRVFGFQSYWLTAIGMIGFSIFVGSYAFASIVSLCAGRTTTLMTALVQRDEKPVTSGPPAEPESFPPLRVIDGGSPRK